MCPPAVHSIWNTAAHGRSDVPLPSGSPATSLRFGKYRWSSWTRCIQRAIDRRVHELFHLLTEDLREHLSEQGQVVVDLQHSHVADHPVLPSMESQYDLDDRRIHGYVPIIITKYIQIHKNNLQTSSLSMSYGFRQPIIQEMQIRGSRLRTNTIETSKSASECVCVCETWLHL